MSARQPPSLSIPPPAWLTELGWGQRYTLLEVIGSGGMGQVWRARDTANDRDVAMKIIDPARSGDEHLLARLETEAASLLRLRDAGQHPHIVPIIDFQQSDSHGCFVMDFIPGQDLRSWCHAHRLDLNKRTALIAKAARAAGWCHQHGIIHRDLKPANILINSATGEPIVVDFSIAKTDEPLALTLTHEALGTTPYMAPEQIDRSRAAITPATDVYALGATLYELLTHVLPHPGDLAQILKRHQNEERPARPSLLNQDVPRDLESICLKALSPRPTDRYPNGDALAADLERFLAGEPVQARPLSTLTYIARQAQRRPALSIAIAACLIISAVAAWSVQRAAKERRQHELEAQVTTAMQGKAWSREALQQADATLAALAVESPASSAGLRTTLASDVISDIETTLQLPYLKPGDIIWMRDEAIPWLLAQNHPQAVRLQSLISERMSRWEVLASVKPPFTDLAGLFARSNMKARGDLLFPDYEGSSNVDPSDYSPAIMVKEDLTTPAEISVTFVADPTTFKRVAIGFEFQKVRTDILLYSVRQAPKFVLEKFKAQDLNPDGLILYTARRKALESTLYISDPQLLRRPFKLTVRIDHNHLDADVNGQWSLPMDDLFATASTTAKNWCGISWPRDLGLRELTIRTRSAGVTHPLERGDLLFSQGKWAEAQRLYESMKGDPAFGIEASYKAALAQWEQKQTEAVLAAWEPLSLGPPSLWRDLSAYRLWDHAASQQGIAAASSYLQRLPEARHISPAIKQIIESSHKQRIINIYQTVGSGMNGLRNNVTEVNEAVKALQIIGIAPVELASKLAMALHTCGLDDAAKRLLHDGLSSPEKNLKDTTEQLAAPLALDAWTRIARSEADANLKQDLKAWCKTFPNNPSLQVLGYLEDARVQARAGDFNTALKQVRFVHEIALDLRQITSSWLLEGMIQRLLGNESEAQKAWKQGIQATEAATQRSPQHLCDLIVLHSLAKAWTHESCTQIITQLMGKAKARNDGLGFLSAFITSFLTNADFVRSLNTITDDSRGRDLAQHYALRTLTARDLSRRWYGIIMERYFISGAFPANPSSEDQLRVQSTIEHLIEAVAASKGDEPEFFSYIQAWATPALGHGLATAPSPHPAPLVARLKWLLAQRYLHLGAPTAAKPLLEAVKSDPTLDEAWRQSIAGQLR